MCDDRRYEDAAEVIKGAILRSQYRAVKATNGEQLSLYYAIGGYVSTNTRDGFWGTGALSSISERLQKKLPGLRGFSERNLKYMRTFYEEWSPLLEFAYEDSAEASAETVAADAIEIRQKLLPNSVSVPSEHFLNIGFSHHCQILTSVKDVEERLYYVEACAREHMSLERLRRAIRNDNYHHQGTLPNNFTQALPSPQQALRAIETFKDEYLLDFINVEELGVRDASDVDERVVEQAIVNNVKNFIMEFGRGFSFISNAYHLDAFGEDQFIDLLFFNRDLNCLVAVELKRGKFKTAYLGQLSGYLSVLDEFERKPHEEPSIGIVLCRDMNEAFVNLVIRNYNGPMGVATYSTADDVPGDVRDALPDIDDLKALLEKEGA